MACVKCKQRHKPPVGISCTRIKVTKAADKRTNTKTTPTTNMNSEMSEQGQAVAEPQPSTSNDNKSAKKLKRTTDSEVIDKLNVMMSKFGELEKHIEQQERRGSSSLFILSQLSAHSSPKLKAAT